MNLPNVNRFNRLASPFAGSARGYAGQISKLLRHFADTVVIPLFEKNPISVSRGDLSSIFCKYSGAGEYTLL